MSHVENDRFAEIALGLRYCNREQVRRCLAIQESTAEHLSLGQSLLREAFITQEQHSHVLALLRESVKEGRALDASARPSEPSRHPPSDTSTSGGWEDDQLGKLALREGWLTPEDLRACGQGEDPRAPRRPLVEILVSRGFLTPARAGDLLKRVSRRRMRCRGCAKTFNVLSLAGSRAVRCPVCDVPLEAGKVPGQPEPQDSLATQTLAALSDTLKAPRRRKPRVR
jgi:hypothetical protein